MNYRTHIVYALLLSILIFGIAPYSHPAFGQTSEETVKETVTEEDENEDEGFDADHQEFYPRWAWLLVLVRTMPIKDTLVKLARGRGDLKAKISSMASEVIHVSDEFETFKRRITDWADRLEETKMRYDGHFIQLLEVAPETAKKDIGEAYQTWIKDGNAGALERWLLGKGKSFLETPAGRKWRTEYDLIKTQAEDRADGLASEFRAVNKWVENQVETATPSSVGQLHRENPSQHPFKFEFQQPDHGGNAVGSHHQAREWSQKNCNLIYSNLNKKKHRMQAAHKKYWRNWDTWKGTAKEAGFIGAVGGLILGAEWGISELDRRQKATERKMAKDPYAKERAEDYERTLASELKRREAEVAPIRAIFSSTLKQHGHIVDQIMEESGLDGETKQLISIVLNDSGKVDSASRVAFRIAIERNYGTKVILDEVFKALSSKDPDELEIIVGNQFLPRYWDAFFDSLLGETHSAYFKHSDSTKSSAVETLRLAMRDAILKQLGEVVPAGGEALSPEENAGQ